MGIHFLVSVRVSSNPNKRFGNKIDSLALNKTILDSTAKYIKRLRDKANFCIASFEVRWSSFRHGQNDALCQTVVTLKAVLAKFRPPKTTIWVFKFQARSHIPFVPKEKLLM